MSRKNTVERLKETFWKRCDTTGTCWIWLGAKNQEGYGNVRLDGLVEKAHRVAYILSKGELNSNEVVMHTCDNKSCCNPAHLVKGSQSNNLLDSYAKNRGGTKRLTIEQVAAIRQERETGATLGELAARYSCTKANICYIVNNKSRRHV